MPGGGGGAAGAPGGGGGGAAVKLQKTESLFAYFLNYESVQLTLFEAYLRC
jgi:hypothetical protein